MVWFGVISGLVVSLSEQAPKVSAHRAMPLNIIFLMVYSFLKASTLLLIRSGMGIDCSPLASSCLGLYPKV